jgi:hypothetical protein
MILKSKCSDIHARVRGNLTTMTWKDKQVVLLMNMYILTVEGNFCDEYEEDKNLSLLKLQSACEIG